MRNLILGKNVAYASGSDLASVAEGAIGIFYNNNGVLTVCATGKEFDKEAMLVLGRPSEKGGPIVLPIHKNKFSYCKGEYQAATTFQATITIPAANKVGDYSIIVARKGVKFNERAKWTAQVHIKDITTDANALAKLLETQINNNSVGSGVKASASDATLTITAEQSGIGYELICADELTGTKVTVSTEGMPAYGDANYVRDLANKAAADAGFEYTYQNDVTYLYPNYPLNPLKQEDAADTGFTIFTLKFAEPRSVKTIDQVVNQIIQVVYPTGATGIAAFETVLKGIAGIEEE